jgi:hypothetical protein
MKVWSRFLCLSVGLSLICFPAAGETFDMSQDPAAAQFVTSNVIATFYHELGHAMIDQLQLAVLGREEDAADTLSTLLIHEVWDEDAATALVYDTANAYRLYAAEAEATGAETPYWDEHSLDLQRYYNLVCLFYGASPEMRGDDASELELPPERAEKCEDEFQLATDSWGAMLQDLAPVTGSKGLRLVDVPSNDPLGAILAQEVAELNNRYALPNWVDVKVETCGEANAFYDPQAESITLCTEYAVDLVRLWESTN